MPKPAEVAVADLKLDLNNYRTRPQKNEKDAIKAMITIKSERFWAILESILDVGYLNTENIIVQKDSSGNHIVKEGNRRIAAMKLALGIYKADVFEVPRQYVTRIKDLSEEWKKENSKIVALIFSSSENKAVENIVSLTHGKGDKASRDPWTSVAKARHSRDANKGEEPALDVLEKYLNQARDITPLTKELWAGDYPITVLHELMRKLTPVIGLEKISEFAKKYPAKPIPKKFDELIKEIGERLKGFEDIRTDDDFNLILNRLDLPVPEKAEPENPHNSSSSTGQQRSTSALKKASPKKAIAVSNNDPKFITQTLKKFIVRGDNREKVVALRDEALRLKTIEKYPYSFCFLLRSMFEISGKAYCTESKIPTYSIVKNKKMDKKLIDILKEARKHLITNAEVPKAEEQMLHGAIVELSKPEGLLSVTSLNQLVHNPKFSTSGRDIASIFSQVYPLLEKLNS